MPAKNRTKQYIENGYYHIYNRGVNKMPIFHDEQDYNVFLHYLKQYLLPKDEKLLLEKIYDPSTPPLEKDKTRKLLQLNNFSDIINLLAHCLMPNHFHFLIKQTTSGSIDKFMNSFATRYTSYFNRKYKRVGPLYQGVYKAALVLTDEQLIQVSIYIHNQSQTMQGLALQNHLQNQPSSLPEYIGIRKTEWIKPEEVLEHFSKTNPTLSYESAIKEKLNLNLIKGLTLDDLDQ